MSRVNLDSKVWNDPRVRRLARLCGWGMPQTVGTLAAVWNVAYEAKDPVVSKLDIDTAAERDGFADLMLHPDVRLAELEDDGRAFLHGVKKRIHYLLKQAERGRLGGERRMATAERTPSGRLANAKQTPGKRLADAKHIPVLPPDLDPDLDLPLDQDQDLDPKNKQTAAPPLALSLPDPKPKGKHSRLLAGATPAELASARVVLDRLGERSGVNYRGSEKHVAMLIRLMRQGVTEWDMRRMIGYCAEKLGWQGHPKMHVHLKPEVIFGPENYERYLDPARAWEPRTEAEVNGAPGPALRLVDPVEAVDNARNFTGEEWEEPEWATNTNA